MAAFVVAIAGSIDERQSHFETRQSSSRTAHGRLEKVISSQSLDFACYIPGIADVRHMPHQPENVSDPTAAGRYGAAVKRDRKRDGTERLLRERVKELECFHGIIAGHGGRIDVQSQPGHGTCMCVRLPANYRQTGAPAPQPKEQHGGA